MFGDSSQDVFSAVAFLRGQIVSEHGNLTELAFVSRKARVAPMKALTVPKLELQAALLSTRLRNDIQQALTLEIENFHVDRQYHGTAVVTFPRKATGFCRKSCRRNT